MTLPPLSRSIETFPADVPSAWKASYSILSSDFGASTGLANGTIKPLFSADNLQLRERRLVVTLSPTTQSGFNALSPAPVMCGGYAVSKPAGFTMLGTLQQKVNIGLLIKATGYSQQTLLCDLRSGVYRIPPATNVSVGLLLSRESGGLVSIGSTIAASLVDSTDGPVIRPTQSFPVQCPAGPDEMTFYLNPMARWIDCHAQCLEFGAATAPIVMLYNPLGSEGYQPSIFRDYVNQTWFPSGDPVELFPSSDNTVVTPNAYALRVLGTAGADVVVRQFLEW